MSQPVRHVRGVRSALLLKLVLLERTRDHAEGFERTRARWGVANSRASLDFIDAACA